MKEATETPLRYRPHAAIFWGRVRHDLWPIRLRNARFSSVYSKHYCSTTIFINCRTRKIFVFPRQLLGGLYASHGSIPINIYIKQTMDEIMGESNTNHG